MQRVERYCAGLMVAPDDKEVLARRGVPSRRIVVHARARAFIPSTMPRFIEPLLWCPART